MINLENMTKKEYKVYIQKSIKKYTKEILKSGWKSNKSDARKTAKSQYKYVIKKGYKNPKYDFYNIVNIEGKRVGYLWLIKKKKAVYLAELYIGKKYRYQGYGRDTLHKLEKMAKKLKYNRIELSVFGHNKIAQSLYTQQGFKAISEFRIKRL